MSDLFLTPNRRLAVAISTYLNQIQQKNNLSSWQSCDVLPIQAWLERTWHEWMIQSFDVLPKVLTTQQEMILWQEILKNMARPDELLKISSTAKLAQSAWQLLKQWQIDITDPAIALTTDSAVFQRWALQFQTVCQENNWLDINSLPDEIKKNIKNINKNINKIILVGFTELTPQYQALFSAYKKNNIEIIQQTTDLFFSENKDRYKDRYKNKYLHKIALDNEDKEIITMARWAKYIYDQKKNARIGCVVPHLEKNRAKIIRIFSDVFSDQHTFTLNPILLPFNISAGISLLQYPVIHTALKLLQINKQDLSIETWGNILRSPFVGDAETEQLRRAYFDSRLRNANIMAISAKKLLQQDSPYLFNQACPALANRLQKYLDLKLTQSLLPISQWMPIFIEKLNILGWPGERSVNSQEYQVMQRWLELIDEYSHFDFILSDITYKDALNYLTEITHQTIFQIQTPDAPIQIVGVLEAAGLSFDALWVMGLDDTNWPAAPKPHPFIPQRLQKTLNMPHATAERERMYAEQLIHQLIQSAEKIILSYPLKNAELDLNPSPFLQNISAINPLELILADFSNPTEIIFSYKYLETLEDNLAPAILTHKTIPHKTIPNETIHGGINIFKQQAACPFKAFAELRLQARKLETPKLGLRALDRGNSLHKALELIWSELKSSSELKKLTSLELENKIHTAAEKSLISLSFDYQTHQRYFLLELQRLKKLLWRWLQFEMTRPDFLVKYHEHEQTIILGNITATFRIDRIDEISDNQYLIIDYKAGKNNHIKNWFSSRPDEPQLPLYCLIDQENTVSIAFGQIHPDELGLKGICKKDLNIPSIKTLPEVPYAEIKIWEQQLQNWRIILEELARQFSEGIATVDPKDINETCRQCNLQALCRIHEKIQ